MLDKLANWDTWAILLGLFVVLYMLISLFSAAWSRSKKIIASGAEKRPAKKGMGLFSTLFILLLIVIVVLIFSVVRFYTSFTSHDLVAVVECYPTNGFGPKAFEVVLTPFVNKKQQTPQSFIVRGDDWSIGGDILEWQSYMNILGLKSMYRLTRLQGRYVDAEDEMTQKLTAYPLVEEEEDAFWEGLYNIAVKMPFIKSAHKNFVAAHPFFGDYFEVYVTPSGYTLERFEGHAGD
ncbi:hypothetical protein JXA02_09310 [candidate division KSB1 bacterium]|nr:hypothetical protein [candidate division KSB1 bacterium]RQW04606.1 MAG: hypothetical protein EH222_10985 [candidate division KSB1 bacterium]